MQHDEQTHEQLPNGQDVIDDEKHNVRQQDTSINLQTAIAPRKKTTTFSSQTPASTTKRSLFDEPKVNDPDPASDRLDDDTTPLTAPNFYELMGMEQPTSQNNNPKALATKHGMFGRIQGSYRYANTKYRVFDVGIYFFLVLQILLAAVFIVLGALPTVDSHIAIVVLGAISTVIAGVLALAKGQGLPNRLRQERDGLRSVIFECEELYWDVGAGRSVLFKDIVKVREDYLRVLEEARRNHPDTWNATNVGAAQGIQMDAKGKTTLGAGSIPKIK